MAYSNFILIFLAAFLTLSRSQVLTTYWKQPPSAGSNAVYTDNEILPLQSLLQLGWVTFLSEYSIWLWQQDLEIKYAYPSNPIYTKNAAQNETGGTMWIVDSQNFDLNKSNVFFFSIGVNVTLSGPAFVSHYFNVTTVSPTAATTSITPSATLTSASSSHKTSNTRIGLGVGLGVGIPFALAVAGFLALKLIKPRKRQKNPRDRKEAASKALIQNIDRDSGFGKKGLMQGTKTELATNDTRELEELHALPELHAR